MKKENKNIWYKYIHKVVGNDSPLFLNTLRENPIKAVSSYVRTLKRTYYHKSKNITSIRLGTNIHRIISNRGSTFLRKEYLSWFRLIKSEGFNNRDWRK